MSYTMNAAGKVYEQTMEFVYMSGSTTADGDLSTEMRRWLGVLSTVQDENLLSPRRAFTVEGAIVGSGDEQHTTLRMHGVEPKYD